MFRGIILHIFRSTRLCVTVCGIMHPRCCWLVDEIYKYIKSVLWRVAKRLSYIEDARCLKVKQLVHEVTSFYTNHNSETFFCKINLFSLLYEFSPELLHIVL